MTLGHMRDVAYSLSGIYTTPLYYGRTSTDSPTFQTIYLVWIYST